MVFYGQIAAYVLCMSVFGSGDSEQLLSALFLRRYGSRAWEFLERFLGALSRTELPFDFFEQLRRREYPAYPGYEDGMPTIYYYFVPNTTWGSASPPPPDPLDKAFVYSMDGFGLNFGCPLRLARAIEVLEQLSPEEQRNSRHALASSTKHLPSIEELLWFDVWPTASARQRVVEGTTKTFDWSMSFHDITFRVECKFRPSDWPRLIDGPAYSPIPGSLTKKARQQLGIAREGEINVLAVTGIAEVTDPFRSFCSEELRHAGNIDVLVYQRFVGQISVFSLCAKAAAEVAERIPAQPAQPFQEFYFFVTNRQQAALRSARRRGVGSTPEKTEVANLTELTISSLPPRRYLQEPPLPYRYELSRRLPSGEPIFEYVPPYLNPDE